ncbi:hypothetical protein [Crenalkalicoccus roseus]|uniref:hypothetical protein n=1 Tax=Crenalkalicoccus roseus TaxID=1485588 RepID=UPI0010815FA4|nr:hypothetical protein [Crenalkalicoccus roseus]
MPGSRTASGRAATHHARILSATALLALALAAGPAAAQVLPPPMAPMAAPLPELNFTQSGVPAEATAPDGVQARTRALASGRRIAWQRLIEEAGLPAVPLGDAQIEELVSSIIIEQERIAPTRYSGRITVNFDPSRVRAALAGRVPGMPAPSPEPVARPTGPASTWLDAVATYRSMGEWLELRRRLGAAPPVASVTIQGIATDQARLRLGLRAPPPVAAEELAALGLALAPAAGMGPGETWLLGLAR